MDYLFYKLPSGKSVPQTEDSLPEGYRWSLWNPTIVSVCPRGLPDRRSAFTFLFWWLVYGCGLRRNGCRFFLVYRGSRIVHYTGIMPTSFKFPFMAKSDIQFAPAWTHPEHRRRGLLAFALHQLLHTLQQPGRAFWWVCRENNPASSAAAEKAGFALVGTGQRTNPLRAGLFSRFTITDRPVRSS